MPKKKLLGREIRNRKDVVVKEHAVRTGHNDPSASGAIPGAGFKLDLCRNIKIINNE